MQIIYKICYKLAKYKALRSSSKDKIILVEANLKKNYYKFQKTKSGKSNK